MMATRVADMSVEELKRLIEETVTEVLADILRDPDAGLVVREDFNKTLQRSLETPESEMDTLNAENVAEKLGLRW
jgi:hypothetical protein